MERVMEDRKCILDRYKQLRSASRQLNNTLMSRYKPPVKQAAKELGVLVGDTIVMDMDQMPVLMDYAIHHCRKDGRTVVERFAAEHPPPPSSDLEAVLTVMRQAFFSLFQVRGAVKDVGVHVMDILRRREHFIADVGFSETAVEGFVLASRVLPFEDFLMTTGAALPVEVKVLEWVAKSLEQSGLSNEQLRALPRQAWADMEARVIHACLHSDGNQRITCQDAPGRAATSPVRKESARAGRNDPCPCGSGRKYKKCCMGKE